MLCVEEDVQVFVSIHSPKYDEHLSEKDEEKLNNLIGECKGVTEWSVGDMNGTFCSFTIWKDENYEKDIQKIRNFIDGCKKFKRKG